ncbi:hypothetical protein OG524_36895 (plasmid) [Streptomyces sp. NBC_01520]|uniref:DUF6197 family protein n=1 Tax=Streptomyces sp. NBC_01520 TaxID=2903892 RepID=UPI002F91787E
MPQTHPAIDQATPTTAPPTPPTPPTALSLEERMEVINAAMTIRLEEAALAYEVNTAHIPTEPVDLADVLTVPLAPTLQPPPACSPTPVAAVLQRAHRRLLTGGWCRNAIADEDGALCLFGAVRFEAHRDLGLEMSAISVLLEAIRRQFGDRFESVPAFNDSCRDGRLPMRILGQAADLAHARGL